MKGWKSFNDECSRCGNSPVGVFTDAKQDYAYDGDDVECFECGLHGSVSVDEDDDGIGIAHVDWDDYEDED
jgi:hypothetical protein